MKHLVDCSDSALSRTILQAGIDDHPPPADMANTLAALGLASSGTLATIKILSWFRNSTVNVAVCVIAGGAYLGAPWLEARVRQSETKDFAPSEAAPPPAMDRQKQGSVVLEQQRPRRREPSLPILNGADDPAPQGVQDQGMTSKSNRILEKSAPFRLPTRVAHHHSNLKEEILFVDRLRLSAVNSIGQFDSLFRLYTERFPNGQLKAEAERLMNQRH